jgi:hypothetical protein
LPEPMTSDGLRGHVSDRLGSPARLVADAGSGRRMERVAVLGGSGGSRRLAELVDVPVEISRVRR